MFLKSKATQKVFSKSKFFIVFFIYFYFLHCTCETKWDPVSTANQTHKTSFGTITQIDDYPLFKIVYSSDYKFDEYLQTGKIPYYVTDHSKSINYCCTCFSIFGEGNRLFGRNYDWPEYSTYFIIFTNPPNRYASVSTVDIYFFDYNQDEAPTFSGNENILRTLPYYPFDGMNEKGVVIGMNAVPQAQSPFEPSKITIGELQLIRLVLDYASSTQEAITLIQQYNIRVEDPPIHYLIADSSGHSVIIEFVDGKMEVMENVDPWQVTTNFVITGMNSPQDAPCWRYRTAFETLSVNKGDLSEKGTLSLLQNVSLSTTRWSTVFNIKSGQLQIAMGGDYENLHIFMIH
jgi:hypothetical protein